MLELVVGGSGGKRGGFGDRGHEIRDFLGSRRFGLFYGLEEHFPLVGGVLWLFLFFLFFFGAFFFRDFLIFVREQVLYLLFERMQVFIDGGRGLFLLKI